MATIRLPRYTDIANILIAGPGEVPEDVSSIQSFLSQFYTVMKSKKTVAVQSAESTTNPPTFCSLHVTN